MATEGTRKIAVRAAAGALLAVSISLAGCSVLPNPFKGAPPAEPESERTGALDVLTERIEEDSADPMGPPEPAIRVPERARVVLAQLEARGLDAMYTEQGVLVTFADDVFEFGSAQLTAAGRHSVRALTEVLLKEARGRSLLVEGHTDSIGAELYNRGFSERRAAGLAKALIRDGVPEALVSAGGYGSEYPIAPNENPDGSDNPVGRRKNRRVEVLIE
jgi:outer membrane protein OmpA-like peptidoglycan-associated protein